MAVTLNASTSSGLVSTADTSGVLTLQNNGTNALTVDSGNLQFNSGYGSVATAYGCRAWVNFDGTGTPAIRASGNVSSITDNGTGSYTINFTNAMPDANYSSAVIGNGGGGRDTTYTVGLTNTGTAGTYSASAVQVLSYDAGSNVAADSTIMTVAVFR
jgi:hypothetical protein